MAYTGIVSTLAVFGFVVLLLKLLSTAFASPLRKFDGPFAAKFTDFWRLIDTYRGRCDITQTKLHRKYGPAVRIGPNIISLSDPGMIKTVFNVKAPWKKSHMYNPNDVMVNGVRVSNIFGTTNEEWHTKAVRPIRQLYTMTNVRDFESLLDPVIARFTRTLEERFMDGENAGKPFDASEWVNYFAWDAMSEMTFSKPFGFITEGQDVGGFLSISERSLDYYASVSQVPVLDFVFDKNPVRRIGPPTFSWATDFAVQALGERLARRAVTAEEKSESKKADGKKEAKDFLDCFLEAKVTHPDFVDDNQVVNYLLINLLAGSDTTAISLGAIIYYTLKNPGVHKKLVDELHNATLSFPVAWSETLSLPYLKAVVRETLRIHSGVGLMLERIVPATGLTLPDGRYIPGGSVVGMNPWVVHRSEEYFGPNVDEFVPERWLPMAGETEEEFKKRETKMKEADLTFGHGTRICMGKNLSKLEADKVVATLFKYYDLALVDPNKPWTVKNSWFTYNKNINITIAKKKS
ncbi:uncharacterized protein Z518_08513 [Rhinocladiella mackenziei CBS 650.93]|uniref:Uncharacterized protein n=1 Tax=Rhinocladiella mackenziei CBS 650.93 TaxID=1442369 RepID=A0A0D2FKW6_9EURO|nr:uncharacterized protein Z518_08513 [Rhinocladiella mackenziei CBS 650.93]KIX02572.1 hypothetical protein Z518_08513 [Rhinocladiella mackenziei CBS 650.93]